MSSGQRSTPQPGYGLRLLMSSLAGQVAEWQTRTVQVRVSERTWGFNSPLAHPVLGHSPGLPAGGHRPPEATSAPGEQRSTPGDDPHASAAVAPSADPTADSWQQRTERSMPAGLDTARRTAARVAAIRAPYPGTDSLSPRRA